MQKTPSEENAGRKQKSERCTSRRRFLKLGGLAFALGGAGYTGMSNMVDVSEHREPLFGLNDELRVFMVSDVHLPSCLVASQTLREAHRAFNPHVVMIAGDAVDIRGNEALVNFFAGLPAPNGQFAVLGNWEYWGRCDLAALKRGYERVGVRLLINEVATFVHAGGLVRIVGLDDLLGGRPRVDLVSKGNDEEALLVMAHCPKLFDRMPEVPLVTLSGHTHGGQVAPLGLKIAVPRGSGRYFRGWYRAGIRRLFVSRGLGNSVVPVRVGSRPEIALLTFNPAV